MWPSLESNRIFEIEHGFWRGNRATILIAADIILMSDHLKYEKDGEESVFS